MSQVSRIVFSKWQKQLFELWKLSATVKNCQNCTQNVESVKIVKMVRIVKIFQKNSTILTILTILTIFDSFDNFWKDNPGDLWHLRHWLQFWQLRSWIHDYLCYLAFNCDTGQHSQFLRCFHLEMLISCQFWPSSPVSPLLGSVASSGQKQVSASLLPGQMDHLCPDGNPTQWLWWPPLLTVETRLSRL